MGAKRDNAPPPSTSGSEDEVSCAPFGYCEACKWAKRDADSSCPNAFCVRHERSRQCDDRCNRPRANFTLFEEARENKHTLLLASLRSMFALVLLVLAALAISNFALVVEVKREIDNFNSLSGGGSYDMLDFAPLFSYDPYNVTVADHLSRRGAFMTSCFDLLEKEKAAREAKRQKERGEVDERWPEPKTWAPMSEYESILPTPSWTPPKKKNA